MENKKLRKFNTEFRQNIKENLENNLHNMPLVDIYNIIVEDIGHNYSSNSNGIFINLNILSDKCIDKLLLLIEKYKKIYKNNVMISTNKNENTETTNYKFDDVEIITELGHKLTNQEKTYIKKIKK